MAQATAGLATHGTLFFAREQWAGKGQRGRTWTSMPGENIVLSAVLEPVALLSSQAFTLSACVALACHDLFSHYAGSAATRIKWPNDLYWGDRKAGGILIENNFRGDNWSLSIAGMGININQSVFPGSARNPVSLKQITGKSFDAVGLARELGDCLDRRYRELEAGVPTQHRGSTAGSLKDPRSPGARSLIEQYNDRLYKRNETIRLKKDNAVFETRVEAVSAQGQLLTRDVLERSFAFGEVDWLI